MIKKIIDFVVSLFSPLNKDNKIKNIKSVNNSVYCQTFKMSFDNSLRTLKTGLIKDPEDNRDFIKTSISLKEKGQEAVDVQNNVAKEFSLRKYAPPTKLFNQRSTSACGGFSGSAFVYIIIRRMEELSGNAINSVCGLLSPLWIYWHARKYDRFGSEKRDDGTTLRSVMKALKEPGVLFDKYFSFSKNTPLMEPGPGLLDIPRFKIEDYCRINMCEGDKTIYEVKDILCNEQLPIEAGILLYEEQMTNFRWNGYLKPVDLRTAHCIGGHAVCITGYKMDNKGQCWVEFINSWGESFGDAGYGYFPVEWLNDRNYVMDLWTVDKGYF